MEYFEVDFALSIKEDFERVINLLYQESKNDPETEPYKSKYKAQDILEKMKHSLLDKPVLNRVINTDETDEHVESMLCSILMLIGTISIETEELHKGEENLNIALEKLNSRSLTLKPKGVLITLTALNQLGLLWSQRADSNKSYEYLQRAEKLYLDYKDLCTEQPVNISELFGVKNVEDEQWSLEKLYTLTLYYLAQVHGALGNNIKSSIYCHTTLKKQLDYRGKDFDAIDWALNSATLAQFFMEKNAFHEARHHMAAASFILEEYERSLLRDTCSEEEMEAKKERLKHRGADVARCWAKYDIVLLSASKDRLMDESGKESNPTTPDELIGLKFPSIDVTPFEVSSDSYILTFDDAKVVFLDGQKWLKDASEYYTLENHASDNIQIVRDMSELYKGLIFFEDDEDRQAKMYKRRLDLLHGVLKEINPQYYITACRQIWFEIGEIESAILEIKLSRLQSAELPTPQALQKINRVIEQGINAYNQFLNTLKDVRTGDMPKTLPADLETSALLAYFYLGRLHNKLSTPDTNKKLDNLSNSIHYFQKFVDYCESNQKAKEEMAVEFQISEEMAKLLSMKLTKLTESNN